MGIKVTTMNIIKKNFSNDFKVILVGVICLFMIILYYAVDIIDQLELQKQSSSQILDFEETIRKLPKGNNNTIKNNTTQPLTNDVNIYLELNIIASYYGISLNKSNNNYVLTGNLFDVINTFEHITLFKLYNNLDIEFAALDININQAKLLLLINQNKQ